MVCKPPEVNSYIISDNTDKQSMISLKQVTQVKLVGYNWMKQICDRIPGLEIHFFSGSKLLPPSSRPGSKTNVVVPSKIVCTLLLVTLIWMTFVNPGSK